MNSTINTGSDSKPLVYARSIAQAMEKYLEAADTSVHWVQPSSDETSWGPPKLRWPTDDVLFAVTIEQGMNEGTKVSVSYRTGYRTEPQCLLSIKLLCGTEKAFSEAVHVHRFLHSLDLQNYVESEGFKA